MIRGYWGSSADLLFDASVAYGHRDNKHQRVGFSDTYNLHNAGFGVGVNVFRELTPLWRAEGRLGWSRSWTIREASTDTASNSWTPID